MGTHIPYGYTSIWAHPSYRHTSPIMGKHIPYGYTFLYGHTHGHAIWAQHLHMGTHHPYDHLYPYGHPTHIGTHPIWAHTFHTDTEKIWAYNHMAIWAHPLSMGSPPTHRGELVNREIWGTRRMPVWVGCPHKCPHARFPPPPGKRIKPKQAEPPPEKAPLKKGDEIFCQDLFLKRSRAESKAQSTSKDTPEFQEALNFSRSLKGALAAWDAEPALAKKDWAGAEDPLSHWRSLRKRNAECCRNDVLMFLIRHLFAVPGSSANIERAFSHAGRAINTKRASLEPQRAAATIFMHENDLRGLLPWN